jgi:hypothetical protein
MPAKAKGPVRLEYLIGIDEVQASAEKVAYMRQREMGHR